MNTKTIITTCLLLLGTMALQAQELKYFRDNFGKYGYKDQSGKIIVEPKYDMAFTFMNGVAPINIGGDESLIRVGIDSRGGKRGF
ncbi:MAG TPA: WG repeat-containing protein [Flavobacteriaceae bacterium]|nr:WG repeat-containing protein [Flavobacteriaceae bacterium]